MIPTIAAIVAFCAAGHVLCRIVARRQARNHAPYHIADSDPRLSGLVRFGESSAFHAHNIAD